MGAVNIGPLSLSVELLSVFAAVLLSIVVGNRAGRARGVSVEPTLWIVIFVALLAARTAFVVRYLDLYSSMPLSIPDIRDGGFLAPVGVLAALATVALLAWRQREKRGPLIAAVLAGVGVWALAALITIVLPNRSIQIPQLALTGLDGRSVQLETLVGKPLVVNMWASWCPPCRREMPVLREAQLRRPDVTFVFANQAESAEAVRKYLAAERIDLNNVLLDSRLQLGAATGSNALPTTLFFSAKGQLIERRLGELSAATLAQRLELLDPAK